MIARYRALAQRVRQEMEDLERTQSAVLRHWQGLKTATEDQDVYLNSVAFNLHGFYSGLERIFELIAMEVDGGTLGGASWHTQLPHQMSLDVPDSRPPVIDPETARQLDRYRKFRHVVRNVYAMVLDSAQIEPLVRDLPSCWTQTNRDILAFLEYLEAVANSQED